MSTVVEKARAALVRIETAGRGAGAGTIWHPEGLILTNAHVAGKRALRVTLPNGETTPARVVASDKAHDLAALTVKSNGLPAVELGNSKQLRPGDWVVALGHPWGVQGAATAGVVIAVGVPPEMASLGQELIQVSLHLRPGHSGGPLVDTQGRLVGVNTMMAGPNAGLAIPVQTIKLFLKEHLGKDKLVTPVGV
ncbi:MAG: trypsin-like serine protease [Anaerolineales bacterium]|nr:trypsin-like serine protease [Anaerolineales bacterium]